MSMRYFRRADLSEDEAAFSEIEAEEGDYVRVLQWINEYLLAAAFGKSKIRER